MTCVVALSGSLRAASTNAALLQVAAQLAPRDMQFVFYENIGELPHFNPDLDEDDDSPPEVVRDFRRLLIDADGIIICCPEYAHGVPGVLKNAIDWLVSVGALVGKPVLLLNASPAGGEHAQASLLHTLQVMNWNVLTEASLTAPFLRKKLQPGGVLDDENAANKLRASLGALAAAIGK
jgi:NAD(P)H-dependent FMN reductase